MFLFRGRWNCLWKGEKIKSFLFFFYVSNFGGELVYMFVICCYCIYVICCLSVFISTRVDVLFWVFQERKVHSDQDLLPFLVTFGLEVLDWNLWCIWAFYGNRTVLVFEYFILYVSFVTDCQKERLLDSKSLEQLANHEHK